MKVLQLNCYGYLKKVVLFGILYGIVFGVLYFYGIVCFYFWSVWFCMFFAVISTVSCGRHYLRVIFIPSVGFVLDAVGQMIKPRGEGGGGNYVWEIVAYHDE